MECGQRECLCETPLPAVDGRRVCGWASFSLAVEMTAGHLATVLSDLWVWWSAGTELDACGGALVAGGLESGRRGCGLPRPPPSLGGHVGDSVSAPQKSHPSVGVLHSLGRGGSVTRVGARGASSSGLILQA